MSILSQEELTSVIADAQAPALSIFLPTHRAGPDFQQDAIRLKNLLKQAELLLIAKASRPVEVQELLAPVSDLLEDADFWRHQEEGLAILRSPNIFRVFRLPLAFDEFCSVSERFYVKPLLPLLINEAPASSQVSEHSWDSRCCIAPPPDFAPSTPGSASITMSLVTPGFIRSSPTTSDLYAISQRVPVSPILGKNLMMRR